MPPLRNHNPSPVVFSGLDVADIFNLVVALRELALLSPETGLLRVCEGRAVVLLVVLGVPFVNVLLNVFVVPLHLDARALQPVVVVLLKALLILRGLLRGLPVCRKGLIPSFRILRHLAVALVAPSVRLTVPDQRDVVRIHGGVLDLVPNLLPKCVLAELRHRAAGEDLGADGELRALLPQGLPDHARKLFQLLGHAVVGLGHDDDQLVVIALRLREQLPQVQVCGQDLAEAGIQQVEDDLQALSLAEVAADELDPALPQVL
mmetsp:Transcript_5665/g.13738  ORF Transcript_5665/g.13738 Transcript_5665/m.13738 type:complete len:262 (-) Transcript_5665:1612-2397(-)